jgi:nuclear pore complex protein Nup93
MVVHAVHMAIALYEKKLLNLTKSATAQLSFSEASDPKSVKRINLASLLKMYTRKFECTDPREALEYYYFLRDLRTPQNESFFALFISELALETREFELLFGKLEKNGARKPGAIDKFLPETDRIISIVAREIENRGLVEEAIKLYDLCKEQQRVMELCNKLLSQVVSEVNVPNSNRDRLKAMATSIAQRYKIESGCSVLILKSVSNTFYLLTELMHFFDIYHSENWELAYETLNNMDVLPDTADKIESHVKKFSAFSEEVFFLLSTEIRLC